jgi:hypothetical protein
MRTVHVRIAVAVDTEGDWNSCGWRDGDEKDVMGICVETLGSGEARYWLEADLPVPCVQTIQAAVSTMEGMP